MNSLVRILVRNSPPYYNALTIWLTVSGENTDQNFGNLIRWAVLAKILTTILAIQNGGLFLAGSFILPRVSGGFPVAKFRDPYNFTYREFY